MRTHLLSLAATMFSTMSAFAMSDNDLRAALEQRFKDDLGTHLLDSSVPVGAPRIVATADTKRIDALVGGYRLQNGLGMELRHKGNALTIQAERVCLPRIQPAFTSESGIPNLETTTSGNKRFRRQPALDQAWRRRSLHDAISARAARVLGPARHDHPDLGRDLVEPP